MKSKYALSNRMTPYRLTFYTVAIFILICGLGEASCNVLFSNKTLHFNPLASTNYLPAISLFDQLGNYVERHGAPSCIFIGNSLVHVGIDPVVFEEHFNQGAGKSITCFNFGMDGSAMTSTGAMGLILSKLYKPTYLILGVSVAQFRMTEDDPENSAQSLFRENNWVKYSLGSFNVEGWLANHSALYRVLKIQSARLFPGQRAVKTAPQLPPTNVRPNVLGKDTDVGYSPFPAYQDTSPLYKPNTVRWGLGQMNPQALEYLQQVIDQAHRGDFKLVLVEMPVWEHTTLADSIMGEVKAVAQKNGVPYLSVQGLPALPASAYSDSVHLHITGSQMFSEWLGTQLGNAVKNGALANVNAPEWSPTMEKWPEPAFLSTLGLSKNSYATYLSFSAQYDLLPQNGLVFNPGESEFDQTFAQSLVGFQTEWESNLTKQNRTTLYQLMSILGKMRFERDLKLSATDQAQLSQWRVTLDPSSLTRLGIHFVICRENLASPETKYCPAGMDKHPNYKLIGAWKSDVLYDKYRLFQVETPKD